MDGIKVRLIKELEVQRRQLKTLEEGAEKVKRKIAELQKAIEAHQKLSESQKISRNKIPHH